MGGGGKHLNGRIKSYTRTRGSQKCMLVHAVPRFDVTNVRI